MSQSDCFSSEVNIPVLGTDVKVTASKHPRRKRNSQAWGTLLAWHLLGLWLTTENSLKWKEGCATEVKMCHWYNRTFCFLTGDSTREGVWRAVLEGGLDIMRSAMEENGRWSSCASPKSDIVVQYAYVSRPFVFKLLFSLSGVSFSDRAKSFALKGKLSVQKPRGSKELKRQPARLPGLGLWGPACTTPKH